MQQYVLVTPVYYSVLTPSCRLWERYTIYVLSMLLTSTDIGGRLLWMHKCLPTKSACMLTKTMIKTIIEHVQKHPKILT